MLEPVNAYYSSRVVVFWVWQWFCKRFLCIYAIWPCCCWEANETDLMCEAFNYRRDLATILRYHIFYWRWRMRRKIEDQWDEAKQWQTFLEQEAYFFADDLMVKLLWPDTFFVFNLVCNTVIGVLDSLLALLWLIWWFTVVLGALVRLLFYGLEAVFRAQAELLSCSFFFEFNPFLLCSIFLFDFVTKRKHHLLIVRLLRLIFVV